VHGFGLLHGGINDDLEVLLLFFCFFFHYIIIIINGVLLDASWSLK
jgi:hypothetical protein